MSNRRQADPTGAIAAERAEMRARKAVADATRIEAQANSAFYGNALGVYSSMPPLMPASGSVPNRTDTPYALGNWDFGNTRWQNPIEIYRERERSRQLETTNWLARSVLDRSIERVLGTLIRIEPRTKKKTFNREVRAWLESYWYSRSVDIRNLHSFSKICHLAYRAKRRDGDVGIVLTEDDYGNPKLQIIEAQRIKTPNNGQQLNIKKGNRIWEGVEMNDVGAPVAYWVSFRPLGGAEQFTRVDQQDFIFLMETSRAGNVRGEPAFRGGYWLFDQVMGYLEAVVVAARVGASSAMIQKRKNPGTAVAPNVVGGARPNFGRGQPQAGMLAGQPRQTAIAPGMINVIGVDEDIVPFNPSQPTTGFSDAINVFARFIGIRWGLTLEDVLLNFEKVNYSSSKAAKNASKLATAIEQEEFARAVISRTYQWALSKAINNGTIQTPPPESFWDHEWIPPVWGSVEPVKDIQAAEKQIALGVNARRYVAAEMGWDFEDLCKANGEDQDLMAENGLSTAIAVGNGGNQQAEGIKDGGHPVPDPAIAPTP